MKAYLDFEDIYILISGGDDYISSILFSTKKDKDDYTSNSEVAKAVKQLKEYLLGTRHSFDLNLSIKTTDFNSRVYEAMQNIPYGSLSTYKDIALAAGSPKAYRAVGNANNKNQFVIVIPCHRVVGSNNKLVGFAPGIRYKEKLIELETKIGGYYG